MDRDNMEKAFTMFYEAMGWNVETGIPTRETLGKFDLGDVADKPEKSVVKQAVIVYTITIFA